MYLRELGAEGALLYPKNVGNVFKMLGIKSSGYRFIKMYSITYLKRSMLYSEVIAVVTMVYLSISCAKPRVFS